MSIKDSLIERYQNAGGADPAVMDSTTRLVKEVGNGGGGESNPTPSYKIFVSD